MSTKCYIFLLTCIASVVRLESKPPSQKDYDMLYEKIQHERFDLDGDGKFSREEQKRMTQMTDASIQKHWNRVIAQYDQNNDGELSSKEIQNGKKRFIQSLLKTYDADSSGFLSKQEKLSVKYAYLKRGELMDFSIDAAPC